MIIHRMAEDVNTIIDEIVTRVGPISEENIHQLRGIIFDKLNNNMIFGYESYERLVA